LLSVRGKLRLLAEPLITRRGQIDDSAATFFTRRFGAEAARLLAGAFIGGVYAGDPARLSAAAAFPLFWEFEQQHGGLIRGALVRRWRQPRPLRSVRPAGALFSFKDGLGQLPTAFAAQLGAGYRGAAAVEAIERSANGWRAVTTLGTASASALVLAVPPDVAARLLAPLDPLLAELLAGVVMAPVAVVHLGFAKRLERLPEAFGFLAPRGEQVAALGVLFPSRIFEGRSSGDLLAAYHGGMLDPAACELDDDALVARTLDDLARVLAIEDSPSMRYVVRRPRAIPQLEHGHLTRLAAIATALQRWPKLGLAGNYLRGVGLKDAVAAGEAAAEALLQADA
jgi:oxygen-dependent protoporphyrinogen oxidase